MLVPALPIEPAALELGSLALGDATAGVVLVGGDGARALELVRRTRAWLTETGTNAPLVFTGRGPARSELEAAGADEVLARPTYLRDVVTIGRLLRGIPAGQRDHLVGSLVETTGVLTLVRAFATLGRSAVLTLIRGLRRGEVRFYLGEVTSAQVGLIHGQAALHQLLLWTDARFDYAHEDIVRRQQIPLAPDELFADAEQFLEGVREHAGALSPATVLEQDVIRVQSLGKQIPTEVHGVLRMFDGHRVLADVLEDSPYRVFEILRVAQKAVEAGLLRRVESQRPKATWRAVLAIEEWLVGNETRDAVVERTAALDTGPVKTPRKEKTKGKGKGKRRHKRMKALNPQPEAKAEIDWGALVPRVIGAEVGSLSGVVPAQETHGEVELPTRDRPREGLEALMDTDKRHRIFPTDIGLEPTVVIASESDEWQRVKEAAEASAVAEAEAATEAASRARANPDSAADAVPTPTPVLETRPSRKKRKRGAAGTPVAEAGSSGEIAASVADTPPAGMPAANIAEAAAVLAEQRARASVESADHAAAAAAKAKAEADAATAKANAETAAREETEAAAKAKADADAAKAKADAEAAKAQADAEAAKAQADADAATAKADADAAKAKADADAAKAQAEANAKADADAATAQAEAKAKADADAAKAQADADAATAKTNAEIAAREKSEAAATAKAVADAAKAKADADAAKAKADAKVAGKAKSELVGGHARSRLANLPARPPGADEIDPATAALVAVPQYLGEMKSDPVAAVTAAPATSAEPRTVRAGATDAKELVRALVSEAVPTAAGANEAGASDASAAPANQPDSAATTRPVHATDDPVTMPFIRPSAEEIESTPSGADTSAPSARPAGPAAPSGSTNALIAEPVTVAEGRATSVAMTDLVTVSGSADTAVVTASPRFLISEQPAVAPVASTEQARTITSPKTGPIAVPTAGGAGGEGAAAAAGASAPARDDAAPEAAEDEPSDGVVRAVIAAADTARLARAARMRPPAPEHDGPPIKETTGEIREKPRSDREPEVAEPSILVADLAAAHDAIAAAVARSGAAAVQPSPADAASPSRELEVSDVRRDAVAFTEAEEAFFRGADQAAPVPRAFEPETFDDLDEGYQPPKFWERVFGRKSNKPR